MNGNDDLDDFFENDHEIDPFEMNANNFFAVGPYDFLDLLNDPTHDPEDFLEMNENLGDFAQDAFENDHEIDLVEMNANDFFDDDPYDCFDPLDNLEDFLEMNENLDDFFASSDRNQMDSSD